MATHENPRAHDTGSGDGPGAAASPQAAGAAASPPGHGTSASFDPADAQAIFNEEPRLALRLHADSALLFLTWGIAWLLGYLLLWWTVRAEPVAPGPAATADPVLPPGWAFVGYGLLLAAALAITGIHLGRRSAGMRGATAAAGTLYGLSWPVAFLAVFLAIGAQVSLGAPTAALAAMASTVPCIIVGTLYMAGAAAFRERGWFLLGAWIAVVAGAAGFAGLPGTYLVMATAGGGGMVVAGIGALLGRARRRTTP